MANRIKADWDAIETEYSKGILSNRQIAEQHGITEAAIRKKAKQLSWAKDLKEKIRIEAEKKVRAQEYATKCALTEEGKIEQRKEIEIAAITQSNIIITHRKDIARNRVIGAKMLDELEAHTDFKEIFETLGELMSDPNSNYDRLNEMYKKVISMPGRVDVYKKLTESLKATIGMEREAYGIVDRQPDKEETPQLLGNREKAAKLAGILAVALSRKNESE